MQTLADLRHDNLETLRGYGAPVLSDNASQSSHPNALLAGRPSIRPRLQRKQTSTNHGFIAARAATPASEQDRRENPGLFVSAEKSPGRSIAQCWTQGISVGVSRSSRSPHMRNSHPSVLRTAVQTEGRTEGGESASNALPCTGSLSMVVESSQSSRCTADTSAQSSDHHSPQTRIAGSHRSPSESRKGHDIPVVTVHDTHTVQASPKHVSGLKTPSSDNKTDEAPRTENAQLYQNVVLMIELANQKRVKER